MTNGDVVWPTDEWSIADDLESRGVDPGRVSTTVEELFGHGTEPPVGRGLSLALVAVHQGHILFEHYGRQPANLFHAEREITSQTPLISWSMAKSITHAMVGMLVDDGAIRLEDPVPIAEWKNDARRDITWHDLLRMRDGLDFVEDYVADASGQSRSDVIDMLFGSGADDVFAYARSRPQLHRPGSTWSYSSGTTNIICGSISGLLGGRSSVEAFLRERIFSPLGMASAEPTFDVAGTFIGSSYVHATARDFARFGYLYLRGGEWAGRRLLAEDWVNGARRQHAIDPDTGHGYSEHWWTWNADVRTCAALGYEGQRTIVVPDRDLVVVHLGKWETSTQPFLDRMLTQLIELVPNRRVA
ncbi:MAG: serine hydrolase domain-containing protein [Actinomycetota bacterium]